MQMAACCRQSQRASAKGSRGLDLDEVAEVKDGFRADPKSVSLTVGGLVWG